MALRLDYLWDCGEDCTRDNIECEIGSTCWKQSIKENANESITELKINYIDRGVEDFKLFADLLKKYFPALSVLKFSQNYSHNASFDDFIYFIKKLKLQKLKLKDFQTQFFQNNTNVELEILKEMPQGSHYIIYKDSCNIEGSVIAIPTCSIGPILEIRYEGLDYYKKSIVYFTKE